MGGYSRFFSFSSLSSLRSLLPAALGGALLSLFPSCQGTKWDSPARKDPSLSSLLSPAPDLARLEEPGSPTNWKELDRLAREHPTYATRLRRAFLFLRVHRPDRAKEELDRALALPGLTPEQEALAWYGKALAFSALELPGRARWSLEQARRATRDPSLLARLRDLEAGRGFLHDPAAGRGGQGKTSALGALRIHTRREWGARPADTSRTRPMGRIYRITIHHSGFPCPDSSWRAVKNQIRAIQKNHKHRSTNGEGWADVGYHFFVDPAGGVWEGRSIRWQGAHAGNHRLNRGNIGICLLGDFQDHPPTPAQVRALEKLLRTLMARYGIPASRIYTHRELKSTACPGRYAQPVIDRLRRKLARQGPIPTP